MSFYILLLNKWQIFLLLIQSFSFMCLSVALNFTSDWAEARMTTNATYKSFSNAVVNAEIGLHVGLYGINVTLKGESLLLLLCAALNCNSHAGSFQLFMFYTT